MLCGKCWFMINLMAGSAWPD